MHPKFFQGRGSNFGGIKCAKGEGGFKNQKFCLCLLRFAPSLMRDARLWLLFMWYEIKMQLDEEGIMLKSISRTLSKSIIIWGWAELSRNPCWTEIDEMMSQCFHPSLCPIIMKFSIADLCLTKISLICWPSTPNRNRIASRTRNKFGAFMASKDGQELVKETYSQSLKVSLVQFNWVKQLWIVPF